MSKNFCVSLRLEFRVLNLISTHKKIAQFFQPPFPLMHPRLKIRLRGISAEGRAHLEAHRMYSVEDIVGAVAQPNFFNSSLISGLSTTDSKTLIGILPRCI
eukprot:Selendium_serpulae@DN6520_c5_g3_i6.p1